MDHLFDVQYLLDTGDYATISTLYKLWKKRRMAKGQNRLYGQYKSEGNHDDSLWDESLNLQKTTDKQGTPDSSSIYGDGDEDGHADTESSIDGSSQYEHVIPHHIDSDTDQTESDMGQTNKVSEKMKTNNKQSHIDFLENKSEMPVNTSGEENSEAMTSCQTDNNTAPSSASMMSSYDHAVPNQMDDDEEMKETFQNHEKKTDEEADHEIVKLDKSHALAVETPGDGSCFYHAISRYITVNDKTNDINILDLPSIVKKNVKDYEKKHKKFYASEHRVSKYLRQIINSFIYDNVDMLLQLIDVQNLLDDNHDVDMKTIKEMLQTTALESFSSDTKWAGTAQIFAFSLMTETPLSVWVGGFDNDFYVRGTATAFQLTDTEKLLRNNPRLQDKFDTALQNINVKNKYNTEIHIVLRGCHYETLVLTQ